MDTKPVRRILRRYKRRHGHHRAFELLRLIYAAGILSSRQAAALATEII